MASLSLPSILTLKKGKCRAAFLEGPGSVPSTDMAAHSPSLIAVPGDQTPSSGLQGHLMSMVLRMAKHSYTVNKNKIFLKEKTVGVDCTGKDFTGSNITDGKTDLVQKALVRRKWMF